MAINFFKADLKIGADNTLVLETDDGYIHRYVIYKWEGNKLVKNKKTETYKSFNDGKMHTDIYKYDSKGNEYLDDTIIKEDTTP